MPMADTLGTPTSGTCCSGRPPLGQLEEGMLEFVDALDLGGILNDHVTKVSDRYMFGH